MTKQFDVIIFGATGYTGKYAILEGIKLLKNLTWAIAGRNKEKLETTLSHIGNKMNVDLSKIPIITADVGDSKSLVEMTAQAKVIVNCCGPYYLYGEAVVKACIETATSHVDVSGEPLFIESMQLKYNDAAREKGIYIISACGFDSIPAEMGINFMQQKFKGTINWVESYARGYADRGYKLEGAALNSGTYNSAVHAMGNFFESNRVRAKLYNTALPEFKPKLKSRHIHRREIAGKTRWCLPLIEPDPSVVRRSQRYLFEHDNQRPIQMDAYFVVNHFYQAFIMMIFGLFLAVTAQFSFGRNLLLNYPECITMGFINRKGPKEETVEKSNFELTLFGRGWKEELSSPTDNFSNHMNKEMVVKVTGKNPGYGATNVALLLSAMTILKESDKMPENGGVFSPGAAFKKTNLLNELQNNGIKFEVISGN